MHSDSARFSQTIIHSALYEDLNEKLPDPSNNDLPKTQLSRKNFFDQMSIFFLD